MAGQEGQACSDRAGPVDRTPHRPEPELKDRGRQRDESQTNTRTTRERGGPSRCLMPESPDRGTNT